MSTQATAGQAPRSQGPVDPGTSLPGWAKLLIGGVTYFGLNFAMSQMLSGPKQTGTMVRNEQTGEMVKVASNTRNIPPFQLRPKQLDPGATYSAVPNLVAPIWPMDSYVDIVVTLSDTFVPPRSLDDVPSEYRVMDERHFKIGNYSDKRVVDTTFRVPHAVQQNHTLWGHFFVALEGHALDRSNPKYSSDTAYHFAWPLTHFVPRKIEAKRHSLLGSSAEDDVDEAGESLSGQKQHGKPGQVVVSNLYHPNISLSMVPDSGVIDFQVVHPAVRQAIHLEASGARDGSGSNSWYYPILWYNTFWQLTSKMTIVNETVSELPLRIDIANLANWKFTTMSSIEMGAQQARKAAAFGGSVPGGGDGSEIEMVKQIFLDTNPILLAVTAIVSVAHMVLETLAFGSDIAHYRKKKDNVGISVRTILVNVFMQAVILLYLIDNSQNTSWVILGSQLVGILIELWKVTTVVNVRVRPGAPGAMLPYTLMFEDKHKLSETEEKTKEYDEIAFKYVYIAGVPLLLAYAAYSLVYESHKSWYSFILTTLVGSVYAYGFLMMVPSLYINYRLKSVAHMPAKAMMYKFLNTFIDDLFAFTIKMPLLHRLATLRDDVIFFIYLYQRWAYTVDYTRVNEFGQGGDDDEGARAATASAVLGKQEKKVGAAVEGPALSVSGALDDKPSATTSGAKSGVGSRPSGGENTVSKRK